MDRCNLHQPNEPIRTQSSGEPDAAYLWAGSLCQDLSCDWRRSERQSFYLRARYSQSCAGRPAGKAVQQPSRISQFATFQHYSTYNAEDVSGLSKKPALPKKPKSYLEQIRCHGRISWLKIQLRAIEMQPAYRYIHDKYVRGTPRSCDSRVVRITYII